MHDVLPLPYGQKVQGALGNLCTVCQLKAFLLARLGFRRTRVPDFGTRQRSTTIPSPSVGHRPKAPLL